MKDLSPYGPRHATEPTHDDTYDVARELGVHAMHAYGHISAFRARYPLEAPHGRLRDVAQIERLALWDGAPGALAAAFEKVGIVDRVDGQLVAHDHEHYAGAVLKARVDGRERTRRWRQSKDDPQQGTDTSAVTVTSHATSPSLSLTHSLGSDQDPDPIAHVVPTEPPRDQLRRYAGSGGISGFEAQFAKVKWADSAEGVIERYGTTWQQRWPQFDGRNGRLSLIEAVKGHMVRFKNTRARSGDEAGSADELVRLLGLTAKDLRGAWERDGCPTNPRAGPRKGKPVAVDDAPPGDEQ